ncbi:MAG: cysteine desulfurase [Nitrospinae bacterium]|nr:cysteine desulfurase [Nitrospinota bacterium]
MKTIYLDHNATTPLSPEVLSAMLPVFTEYFGNPSSVHSHGRSARVRIDEARERVAGLVNAHPGEIVFTSGGSESDSFAIKGTAFALRDKGRRIVTSQTEHPAVLNACRELAGLGFQADCLPVDRHGRIDLEQLEAAIREDTVLVTVQHANSETGTLQEIERIAEIARARGVLFHTDAVQSVGKIPVDVKKLSPDLLSISAHKLNGPKGVGALYIRKGCPKLTPLISGGGQEKKRRGGTENVAGIVGFGKACELAKDRLRSPGTPCLESLRERLRSLVMERVAGVELFGHPESRLPNTLSLAFDGVGGETLLIGLDVEGISVSAGSACSSGSLQPSHVLSAMGIPAEKINSSLRLSVGWTNTLEEMETVAEALARIVRRARGENTGKTRQERAADRLIDTTR